jgi:hypothetical protein
MVLAYGARQELTSIRHGKVMGRRETTTTAKLGHFFLFQLCLDGSASTKRLDFVNQRASIAGKVEEP